MARKSPPEIDDSAEFDQSPPSRPARPHGDSLLRSRLSVITLCALVVAGTIGAYAREAWLPAATVLCRDGLIALLWVAAATMLGSILVPRLNSGQQGPLTLVTGAAIGLGVFSLVGLGLGLVGWLNLISVILLPCGSALIWVIALTIRLGNVTLEPYSQALEAWLRTPARWGWAWLIAMPFLGMAAIATTVPSNILWRPLPNLEGSGDPHPYDVLEYHLQVPREWYEAGRIEPLGHNVFSYFPFNVEMNFLLGMHLKSDPWGGMYLAQILSLSYTVLSVAAIYATIRQLRRIWQGPTDPAGKSPSNAPAVLAGIAAGTVPWLVMLGSVAYNECGLLLYGALTIGWILIAVASPHDRVKSLAMAGLMAGLACGVKYTAIPILLVGAPAVLIGFAVAGWWSGVEKGIGKMIAAIVLYGAIGTAACAPWLVRNWAWTGNPVFPEALGLFGPGHFTPEQVQRWELAHSAPPALRPIFQRLTAAWHEILFTWRYSFVLLPLGVLALIASRGRAPAVFLICMLVLLAGFWLFLTHLQSRFFILCVPMAAMLLGMLPQPWQTLTAILVIGGAAIPSALRLDEELEPQLSPVREIFALGLEDLSLLLPPSYRPPGGAEQKLALIGDAQAFNYYMPMRNLRYRTVFDVNVKPGESLIDVWIGEGAEIVKSTHYLLINKAEIQRFHNTYYGIPFPDSMRGGSPIIMIEPPEVQMPELPPIETQPAAATTQETR